MKAWERGFENKNVRQFISKAAIIKMFPKISIDLGEISIKNVSGIFQSRFAFKITNFLKDFSPDIAQVDPLKNHHFCRVYQRFFLRDSMRIFSGKSPLKSLSRINV